MRRLEATLVDSPARRMGETRASLELVLAPPWEARCEAKPWLQPLVKRRNKDILKSIAIFMCNVAIRFRNLFLSNLKTNDGRDSQFPKYYQN